MQTKRSASLKSLARGQGVFYLFTGIWPLVSPSTFQKVTGPKVDFWLVNTVGVLVAVIGGVLSLAANRCRITPEIRLLAIGSALGLTAIDVVYAARRRISPVYLLDAAAEMGLVALWFLLKDTPTEAAIEDRLSARQTKEPVC